MTPAAVDGRSRCRVCGADSLDTILDLGMQPLANAFPRSSDRSIAEPRYPLEFCRCASCGHAQISITVPPDVMFKEYAYVSGTSDTIPAHFREYAREIRERFLSPDGLVVEFGSNDGTLLRAFGPGTRVLGIEPAANIAEIAHAAGIETMCEFFSEDVARRVRRERGPADAIVANNVVAHIDDLRGLVRGVEALLGHKGVFVAEFPYLADLLENVEYDTIYHEHLSYFSVAAARSLVRQAGLTLFDVRHVPVHGGSLRIFVGRDIAEEPSVGRFLASERDRGIGTPEPFAEFARHVIRQRAELRAMLAKLRNAGQRLAGYGAAAKGSTLLNYCGIDSSILDYVVDKSPLKQGRFTPGGRIPIRPTEILSSERPDAVLLLAWNFADEILRQQASYRSAGGRFILPIPVPRLV